MYPIASLSNGQFMIFILSMFSTSLYPRLFKFTLFVVTSGNHQDRILWSMQCTSPSLYFLCLYPCLCEDSLQFGSCHLVWKGIEPRELKFYVKQEHVGFERVHPTWLSVLGLSWVFTGCYWKIEVLDLLSLKKRSGLLYCPFFPL